MKWLSDLRSKAVSHTNLLLATVAALLLALCSTVAADITVWQQVKDCSYLEISRYNRRNVQDTYTGLLEANVAERGYLFTGSILDANEYYASVDRARTAERALVVGKFTPAQREYLADMLTSANNFLDFLDQCMNTYNKLGPVAAGDLVRTHKGYRELQHIREIKNLLRDSLIPPTVELGK